MKNLSEKIAYLKGLADGFGIDKESKEGKLMEAITDILSDMASELQEVCLDCEEHQVRIDDLEEELSDLEDDYYGDFSIDDEDEDDDMWEDDEDDYAFECPKCGNQIYLDLEMLENDDNAIVCPNCNEKIELEFDCDCGVDCDGCDE